MPQASRRTLLGGAMVVAASATAAADDKVMQPTEGKKVPKAMAHFVENTGSETLRFLELFNAPRFVDVSLTQRMALTPHELVQAHLNISRDFINALPTVKYPIV